MLEKGKNVDIHVVMKKIKIVGLVLKNCIIGPLKIELRNEEILFKQFNTKKLIFYIL